MNEAEKLTMLRTLLGITDTSSDADLTAYLSLAKSKILNKMYPFGIPETVTDVPSKYTETQVNIACYLWNKRGAEGETSHTENGITRQYGGSDIPNDMLKEVTSFMGVI